VKCVIGAGRGRRYFRRLGGSPRRMPVWSAPAWSPWTLRAG